LAQESMNRTERIKTALFRTFREHKKAIRDGIIATLVLDTVKDLLRDQITKWVMTALGNHGKWILGNPFSFLTILAGCALAWVSWIVLSETLSTEMIVVGNRGQAMRKKRDRKAIAGILLGAFVVIGGPVYGAYRYYAVPLPLFVEARDSWFAPNYKNSDVYINVNVMNYSYAPVKLHIEGKARHGTARLKPCPSTSWISRLIGAQAAVGLSGVFG
jgi:hypothetical protein